MRERRVISPGDNPFGPHLTNLLAINPVGFLDIAPNLGFQTGEIAGDLALGEVAITVIDRLELTAVDSHAIALQHTDPAAKLDKLSAGPADGGTVVTPEIRDGLVVGHQPTGQPHISTLRPVSRSSRRLEGMRFR